MTSIFGSTPIPQPTPKPAPVMPDPNSAAVMEARRKAQTDVLNRAGRSSTILTAPASTGGDYSKTTLGSGT
jgi:hypothetical protein